MSLSHVFTRVHFGSKYSERLSCMCFCLSAGHQSTSPSTPIFSFHSIFWIKLVLQFMGEKRKKKGKNNNLGNNWVVVSPAAVISIYWLSLVSLSSQLFR